jgi:hypothetical protein
MLMDEQPDLGLEDISVGDISTVSFGSPLKTESRESSFDLGIEADADPVGVDDSLVGAEEDDEGERTIVLPKLPPVSPPAESAPCLTPIAAPEVPTPARQPKVRINSEMERVAVSDIMWREVDLTADCSYCRARYGLQLVRSLCQGTPSTCLGL